jgi:hypothetical protein
VPVSYPLPAKAVAVVPLVTAPVRSNANRKDNLYSINSELGKNRNSCKTNYNALSHRIASVTKLPRSVIQCIVPTVSRTILSATTPEFVPAEALPLPVTTVPAIPNSRLSPIQDANLSAPLKQYHHHPYTRDRLDAHVDQLASKYKSSLSWGDFIRSVRGKGDLHPNVKDLDHPAAHLLSRFQKVGTPAILSGDPWTPRRIEAALKRGPHSSSKKGIEFLREEYADMIDKQQWIVLPADMIKSLFGLRLSPLGLVPQRNRRDRMISDYSYFDVNKDTLNIAPAEAMQFGRTLWRLLYRIHHANDKFGPVYMSKVDLSDGFYRLWLRPEDTMRLAVLFPSRPNEPNLIGIPMTNPMGWVSSPPNFCACTETVADLANVGINDKGAMTRARVTPHRLDLVSESQPAPEDTPTITTTSIPALESTTPFRKPIKYWDIYVDDFCGLVQGNKWERRAVKRILFQSLDKVFRPLDAADTAFRQEPASIKKLKKGDARWATSMVILGWVVNSITKTISLPSHRADRLLEILHSIPAAQRTIATKEWHKIIGELRSMSIAIPGCKGLFSVLQEAFRHEESDRPRLRLTKTLHGFLDDFRWLAHDLTSRPTRLAELIPDQAPATSGACDAAGTGMGGVHFVPTADKIIPLMWRQPFPSWVRDRLSSFNNLKGDITNSDLELAGSIAQNDVLAQAVDVCEKTTHNSYDNIAAVFWQRKGATTTLGPAAYLLRLQAFHQRFFRYVPLRDYIPGPANVMADALSRRWDLTDAEILVYFNLNFPQKEPWRLCPLRPELNSSLISSLSRRRSDPELLQRIPKERIVIGNCGTPTAKKTASTLSYAAPVIRSPSSRSLQHNTVMAPLLPAKTLSDLKQFQTPSVQWDRNFRAWGPRTRGMTYMVK